MDERWCTATNADEPYRRRLRRQVVEIVVEVVVIVRVVDELVLCSRGHPTCAAVCSEQHDDAHVYKLCVLKVLKGTP